MFFFLFFLCSYHDHDKLIEVKYGNVILLDSEFSMPRKILKKNRILMNSVAGRNYLSQRNVECQYHSTS